MRSEKALEGSFQKILTIYSQIKKYAWRRFWELQQGDWCFGCGGRFSEGRRSDFFDALEEARLPFEADGYRLICYGASLNVFPSGMGRDWTQGQESYQFIENGPKETKDIFQTGEDVIPATVKEQRLFFLQWSQGREGRDVKYSDHFFQWPIEPYPEKQ